MLDRLHKCCRNFPQKVNGFINGIGICSCWTIVVILPSIGFVLLCIAAILGCIYVAGLIPAAIVFSSDPYVNEIMRNNTLPCPINVIYRNVPCSVPSFGLEIATWIIICIVFLALLGICIFCIANSIYHCNFLIMDKWGKIVDVIFTTSSSQQTSQMTQATQTTPTTKV